MKHKKNTAPANASTVEPLTPEEQAELTRHEATLKRWKEAELEAGRALRAIRDKKLYRATHGDFDSYCSDLWGFVGRNAYHLIDAVAIREELTEAPGVETLPAYVSHARALKPLSTDDRIAVWKGLVEEHGADVTTPTVKAAVNALRAEIEAARAEDGTDEPPAVSDPLREALDIEQEADETDAPESVAVVDDLVLLGDAPPEIEPDEYGSLVVSVPRTLYEGAPEGKPYVLTTLDDFEAAHSGGLSRELIRQMCDEIGRLGYNPQFNPTNESIDWAKWTWNPVTGCKHGCVYCYARDIARVFKRHYPQGFRPTIHPGRLTAPENTPLPDLDENEEVNEPGARHVFIDSMGDLFGKWTPDVFIQEVLDTIARHPEWTFKVLTKYPLRLPDFEYPDNLWVGTSVVRQNYVRVAEEAMADVRAAVRWVSCEPLLGPIVFERPELFHLFVIGSQTKTKDAPAIQPEAAWVDALRMQARSVGAAIFEKANLDVHLREFPTPRSEREEEEGDRIDASGDGHAAEAAPHVELPTLITLR